MREENSPPEAANAVLENCNEAEPLDLQPVNQSGTPWLIRGWFVGICFRRSVSSVNPVHEDDIPSDKDAVRIHIVTPEEERWFFAKALKLGLRQLHDLCRLILLMGCRPEELVSVKVTHLDLDRPKPQLRIIKGKTKAAKRNLALHGEAKEILTRLKGAAEKAGSEYIFRAERDPKSKLSMSTVETQQAKLEAPFVIYDFRHTFATRALRDGDADLVSLAMIMGHDGIRSIIKYVHLGQADMDNTLLGLHLKSRAAAS